MRTGGEDLIEAYQDAWITQRDLDQTAALGMNSVRVPIHWEILLDADGRDRPDEKAFARLDWVVGACDRRGLYVVLDLHGLPGVAGPWHSHGYAGSNRRLVQSRLPGLDRTDLAADRSAVPRGSATWPPMT